MTASPRIWLTERSFERLQQELDHLQGLRAVEDVEDADRRNARIQQLREILQHAVVGEPPADDGIAEPGMVLTVRFGDTDETSTFLVGVREATDAGGLEVYSPNSPLGVALCGAREGEQCAYTVPSGTTVRVTLLRAVPFGHHTRPAPSPA